MSGKAHFFVAVVTVASLFFIVRLVRHRQLRAKYSLLWLSVGVGLAVFAAVPGTLDRASKWIGVAYPPTAFFLLAITLLLLIVIHFSWELSRLEERTRTLAEDVALMRAEKSKGAADGDTAAREAATGDGDSATREATAVDQPTGDRPAG